MRVARSKVKGETLRDAAEAAALHRVVAMPAIAQDDIGRGVQAAVSVGSHTGLAR